MKRSFRRCKRKIERQLDQIQSRATRVLNQTIRPSLRFSFSTPISTFRRRYESDDESDDTFSAVSSNDLSDQTNDSNNLLIPCEFCGERFSRLNIDQHQNRCSLRNGNRNVRRVPIPQLSAPSNADISEEQFTPSAPPRSYSPPTLPIECFEIPDRLLCPITFELFEDPVVASDGHTYERAAILRCIHTNARSPLTRAPLTGAQLVPTILIKQMADEVRENIRIARSIYKYQLGFHFDKGNELTSEQNPNHRKVFTVRWIKEAEGLDDKNCVLIHFLGDNANQLADIYQKLPIHPNLIRMCGQVRHAENGVIFLQKRNENESLRTFLDGNVSCQLLKMILSQIASALIFLSEHSIHYGRINEQLIYVENSDENFENLLIKLGDVSNYLLVSDEDFEDEDLAPELRKSLVYTDKSDVYAFGRFVQKSYPINMLNDEQTVFLARCLDEEPTERPNIDELQQLFPLQLDQ